MADMHSAAKKDASFGAHHKNLNEGRPILSAAKMQPNDPSSGNVKFMRIFAGVPWRGRQTTLELSTTTIFSAFAGYIFGTFSDKDNIIV